MLFRFISVAIGVAAVATIVPRFAEHMMSASRPAEVAAIEAPAPPVKTGSDFSSGYSRKVAVRADAYGHYRVDAVVNGRTVPMLVDTGASYVALGEETARRLGVAPPRSAFTNYVETANGMARVAVVRLREIKIGTIRINDVEAVVAEGSGLGVNLLGMSFLRKLSKFESGGSQLVLVQ